MNSTFVTAGLACVIAAIAGGGLKAFSIEIPLLSSMKRQVVLGILGAALLGAGLLIPAPADESKSVDPPKPSLKIAGRVLDTADRPISGASVVVGGQILGSTDELGNFSIPVVQEDVTLSISSPSHRSAQFNVHAPQSASVFHLEALPKEVKAVPANERKKSEADAKVGDVKPIPLDPAPKTEPKIEPKTEPKTDTTTRDSKTDSVPAVTPPQPSLREIVSKELSERRDLNNARRILSTVFGTNASNWDRERVFNTLDSRINSASEQDLRMVKQLLGIQ